MLQKKNLPPLTVSSVCPTALLGVIVRNRTHICTAYQNLVVQLVDNDFSSTSALM
jgi:hypothetical protein